MANKRFYNLQDFKDYIHEDESYDVHGNLNADLLRQNMSLGTLCSVADISKDIHYKSQSKKLNHVITKVCNRFNVDKELLKNEKKGNATKSNYKSIPQKYWGIVLQFIKYTYTKSLEEGSNKPSYLYYLNSKTKYESLDEFDESRLLQDMIDHIKKYIETCVCEKKQYLFTAIEGEKVYIPFRCMRYVENKYLCEHLDQQDNNELWQIIFSKFENMDKFNECIDNPKEFNTLVNDKDFGNKFKSLWNDYVAKSKSKNDYPRSYGYPAYFCEEDFTVLLEGITHSNALHRFYSRAKDKYINIHDKLQAIADMYYVVNLYTDEEEKKNSEKNYSEIAKFVNKEYDEISERFVSYYQKILAETDNESDELKKFQLTFTKQIAINALSEHYDLCAKLCIEPVNRTSTKKYNK